jgi:hypothetical protein
MMAEPTMKEKLLIHGCMLIGQYLCEAKELIDGGVPLNNKRLMALARKIKTGSKYLPKIYKNIYGSTATVEQIVDEVTAKWSSLE